MPFHFAYRTQSCSVHGRLVPFTRIKRRCATIRKRSCLRSARLAGCFMSMPPPSCGVLSDRHEASSLLGWPVGVEPTRDMSHSHARRTDSRHGHSWSTRGYSKTHSADYRSAALPLELQVQSLWSRQQGFNPHPSPYRGDALALSYAGSNFSSTDTSSTSPRRLPSGALKRERCESLRGAADGATSCLLPSESDLALRPLQSRHAATRFSQVLCPPRARGITCSSSNSPLRNFSPQYWQM